MESISEMVELLYYGDNKIGYQALKYLEIESEKSKEVYQYIDNFIEMIDNSNSYIRTRGLLLISCNAKWDKDNRIDEIIDKYLKHITDKSPITARKCIKAIPNIAKYKKDLREDIIYALKNADTEIYKDSMQPLVYKDIVSALKEINK